MTLFGTWPTALVAALMLMMAQVAGGGPGPAAHPAGVGIGTICQTEGQPAGDPPPAHSHDCGFCSVCSALPHWTAVPASGLGWPTPAVGVAASDARSWPAPVAGERRHAQPRGPPARA